MTRIVLTVALVLAAGCAGLTSLNPLASPKLQSAAERITDGLTTATVGLDELGAVVDKLPVPVTTKDDLDCLTLRVVGHDTPSAAVLRTCGSVPFKRDAPMGKAIAALRGFRSGNLCGIVTPIVDALQPLLRRLDDAGVPILTITTGLRFTVAFAGGCR